MSGVTLQFAANLTTLFQDVSPTARFERAAAAGFKGVEMLFPHACLAAETARQLAQANDLQWVLFNIAPGDWQSGDRGLAAQTGREAEFEDAVKSALRYAETIGCVRLHAMAGSAATADAETFIGNLSMAASLAQPYGVDILIEPINPIDMPGYYLTTAEQALEIIDVVGAKNLALQFDLYHRARTHGDTVASIARFAEITEHYQIAGPPDRHEPDRGDWDLNAVLQAIIETDYRGWIGCEYHPAGLTEDGLGWLSNVR